LSKIRKRRSKRDKSAGGKLIFSPALLEGLYLLNAGLAAARIEVRAFKVVLRPAYYYINNCTFEMEIVCCSITS
jgi:hypothetical protein